jgi:hypothetical protein
MDNPPRHAYTRIRRLLARPRAIPVVIHKVVRHAMRRRNLHHVHLAVNAVLLDLVFTTFRDGDLGFVRGINARRGRRRFSGQQQEELLPITKRAIRDAYQKSLSQVRNSTKSEVQQELVFRRQLGKP